jgi:NAD(P)-dependent dehydrogenase (short-subunit alcohol dehydrogenase family)
LAVPYLIAQGGGVIVNMTSGAAEMAPISLVGSPEEGTPIRLGYATTKAALNRLTNALTPDLAPHQIAVIAVDPGFTRTKLVDLLGARGLVDPQAAVPMAVPVATVLGLITADDPLRFSGQVIQAQQSNSG